MLREDPRPLGLPKLSWLATLTPPTLGCFGQIAAEGSAGSPSASHSNRLRRRAKIGSQQLKGSRMTATEPGPYLMSTLRT